MNAPPPPPSSSLSSLSFLFFARVSLGFSSEGGETGRNMAGNRGTEPEEKERENTHIPCGGKRYGSNIVRSFAE